jgi:3-deoxy-manno-octulosonate cytidylyltransferase (CMP-KDO synthetase)
MSTICMIPARFNSSRFPGKLLERARGKTVLQRTFENASRCKELDAIYVATDDERIATHMDQLGAEVIWTSIGCKNGTERIAEALKIRPELQQAEIVMNVQGDLPCTSAESIGSVVRLLKNDGGAVMATAVVLIKNAKEFYSPHVVKCVFDHQSNALYFSRSPIPYSRQGMPKKAYHHIGLYAYRTKFLLSLLERTPTELQIEEDLEQLQVMELGFKIKVAVVEDIPLGIDTPQDLRKLKKQLALEL